MPARVVGIFGLQWWVGFCCLVVSGVSVVLLSGRRWLFVVIVEVGLQWWEV